MRWNANANPAMTIQQGVPLLVNTCALSLTLASQATCTAVVVCIRVVCVCARVCVSVCERDREREGNRVSLCSSCLSKTSLAKCINATANIYTDSLAHTHTHHHHLRRHPNTCAFSSKATLSVCVTLQMCGSVLAALVGLLGSGYCFVISGLTLLQGPQCFTTNFGWSYPFVNLGGR